MARIEIKNLAKGNELTRKDLALVIGGGSTLPVPDLWSPPDRPSILWPKGPGILKIETVPLPE